MLNPLVYRSPIVLTKPQKQIYDSNARFKYVKAGRRFGKTKFGVRWQIEQAILRPGVDHWYVAPTQKMAHEIVWNEYMEQLGKNFIKKASERELVAQLVNNSKIYLKGSDKIDDTLRGRKLGSVVLDEAAYHRSHVWPTIIRPMLADLCAPALFISSPKKSWFSLDWNRANDKSMPEAEAWHFTIYDNPYIDKEEIEKIHATTSEDVWQQEYLANELDYCGKVYTEFTNESIFIPTDKFKNHKAMECVMGADWGMLDPTAVAWMHIMPNGTCIVSAEHVKANWDACRHAEVIKFKSKERKISAGNMVMDPSAFRRESNGTSVVDSFRREGINFVKAEKDIDSGVELMKRFFRGGYGGPWLYISAMCKEAITAANDWEHGDHEPDILAAIRYALTHAVRKKLTHLAEAGAPILNLDDGIQSLSNTIRLPKMESPRWKFDLDFDYGIPI